MYYCSVTIASEHYALGPACTNSAYLVIDNSSGIKILLCKAWYILIGIHGEAGAVRVKVHMLELHTLKDSPCDGASIDSSLRTCSCNLLTRWWN